MKSRVLRRLFSLVAVLVLAIGLAFPQFTSAAQITPRKLTLTSSAPSASTTYTFNFTVPSSTVLQSFKAQVCTTASGACTTPTGFDGSSSTLSSQPTNYGDASGWTVDSTSALLRFKKTGNTAAPSGAQTVVFGVVTNPSTANQTFYARITTYSDDAYTTAVDTGTVAAATAQQITVSATVDEVLTFCTGTSGITSSSCAGATGSSVALGTLTTSSTGSGTSQIGVTTNADSGYVITINGATLTSGLNTIAALSSQTASSQGSSQFGANLKANTTPSVGSNPAGSGSGAPSANYGTADQFRFVTGDTVASVNAADAFRLYTVSYIANISGTTPPGNYTATMTYICTATF